MKETLYFVLMLLIAGACSAKEPSLVRDQELELGGIALGDTESDVQTQLGQPGRTTDTGESIRLDYPGLTIWLGEERRVSEVLSTSNQQCTPSGICPGMPFTKAKAKYGPPLVADRENGRFMEYPSAESSCWLQIAAHKGIIKSVRAECQP